MRETSQGQLLTKLTLSLLRTAWKHKLYTIQIVVFLAGGYMATTAQTETAYILGNHSQTAMASSLIVTGIADRRIRSAGLLERDLKKCYDSKDEALERDKARLAADALKVSQARELLNQEISDFEIKRDNYRDSIRISLYKENAATKQRLERDLRRDFENQAKALQGEYKRLEDSLRKEVETEKRNAASAVSLAQEEAEKVKKNAEVATQRANEIMAECAVDKKGVSQAAKRKVQEVIGINRAQKQDFDRFVLAVGDEFEHERKGMSLNFQQLVGQIKSSGEEINRLEMELRRLRETRFAQGGTDEAKLSRLIHRWLEKELGVILHNFDVDYVGDGVHKFCFLNKERSLEEFQKSKSLLEAYISAPVEKISQNFDKGVIEFYVRLAKKTQIKADEISKICQSADYFLDRAKHFNRVQILAPSESGKTSTAEIIANRFLSANGGNQVIHFPNANSVKNHIVSPIQSKGTEECVDAFINLARRIDAIQDGREALPENFEFHIFDDSDSVISQALSNDLGREEIQTLFTRASHCNLAFILIGHSTAANNFPGMTHSDFNNLIRIYGGADIMTALRNTQVISDDKAKSLMSKFEKIRDCFEEKNRGLGLIVEGSEADPKAYRFVLIAEPNKRPYFCQLPDLDTLSEKVHESNRGLRQGRLPQQRPSSAPAE